MDGLSAAASGIAVVSLAIQLVDSVREIQRFLRSIADAPEELERLIELLEQLELILETIGKLVENQRAQHGDLDIDVSPSITKAVQTCQKTLKRFEVLIAKAKNNSGSTNPAKKYLGRFRLACKKEDIEEFEMQLHRAISNLNLVMTANLTASHSHGMQTLLTQVSSTNAATTAITQELVLLRLDVATNKHTSKHGSRANIRSRQSKLSSYRHPARSKIIYRGILGSVTTIEYSESDHFTKNEGSIDVDTPQNRSWFIIPSFLSRCVQIQYASSFGFVQRTFRSYPLIRDDHPVWEICEKGDATALQQIISNREISPYSVNSFGFTLLHNALWYFNPEVCLVLLHLGLDLEVEDIYGRRPSGHHHLGTDIRDRINSTLELILRLDQDTDPAEFCNMYFNCIEKVPVDGFCSGVYAWVTEENVNLFQPNPLAVVTKRLSHLDMEQDEVQKWKDIGSHLIAKKAAIHDINSEYYGTTSLINVIYGIETHSFDSSTIGLRLLSMLEAAGVDISKYLYIERQRHFNHEWDLELSPYEPEALIGRRRILHVSEREPFSLSWDWWIDPDGNAFEVLHEFRHFGRIAQVPRDDFTWPEELYNWPFVYPGWHYYFGEEIGRRAPKFFKQIARLFHERFKRRWWKKTTKLARMQGTYKKPKMPGSWAD